MVLTLLIIFGAIISWIDIQTHRIPNKILLYLLISTAAISYGDIARFARLSATTLFITLLISILTHVGMGDVKLIAILIPLIGRDHALNVTLLMICISATSIVPATITFLKKGTISITIPWAPSLFAASILYLATQ